MGPDEADGVDTGDARPWVCVFAPTSILMVEIEPAEGAAENEGTRAEVHVHRGGQGLWVASMAASLGARVTVCGPFGGETGDILRRVTADEGIEVTALAYRAGNPALVHDRRGGDRVELASMPAQPLSRHEVDELYGAALVTGTEADVCVLTGSQPAEVLPSSVLGRLAHDLGVGGSSVVADLSGEAGLAVVEQGPTVLKMAHDEVVETGLAPSADVPGLRRAGEDLVGQGVGTMVISRADDPTLVVREDGAWLVHTPPLATVDHRGAGDSMTAGIAVGLAGGASVLDAVRLGAAAGTLNVTRRGLGTGRLEEIERFAAQVRIEELV